MLFWANAVLIMETIRAPLTKNKLLMLGRNLNLRVGAALSTIEEVSAATGMTKLKAKVWACMTRLQRTWLRYSESLRREREYRSRHRC